MERTRIQLADGVYLTYLPARKFKTSLLSAQFVTPLQQETASAYALLPAILRRGTVRYPDLGALSARLDRLYGASVDYTVRKQGENQCVGFVASFIDDSYIPGGEQLLEPVAELLGELLCDPVTERGRFVTAYFEGEKTNLIDRIRTGVVVDYLNCLFINFPVFNFADVCICVGVGLLVLSLLLDMRREQKAKQQKGSAPTDGTA